MKYFIKELLSNPVATRHGRPIAWESLAGNSGVLALDETPENAELIEDLNKLAGKRGVIPCSEDEYSQKKEKARSLKSESPSNMLRAWQPPAQSQPVKKAAAVSDPAPVTPPPAPLKPGFAPRVGRSFRPQRVIPGGLTQAKE